MTQNDPEHTRRYRRRLRARNQVEPNLTPREREIYGVTITAREQTTDATETFAITGMKAGAAIKDCVRTLRRRNEAGADWKIICISTPITIHRDVIASRIHVRVDEERHGGGVTYPETWMLARVDALDLWEPPKFQTYHDRGGRKIA